MCQVISNFLYLLAVVRLKTRYASSGLTLLEVGPTSSEEHKGSVMQGDYAGSVLWRSVHPTVYTTISVVSVLRR
jgi:hypothetical protein